MRDRTKGKFSAGLCSSRYSCVRTFCINISIVWCSFGQVIIYQATGRDSRSVANDLSYNRGNDLRIRCLTREKAAILVAVVQDLLSMERLCLYRDF